MVLICQYNSHFLVLYILLLQLDTKPASVLQQSYGAGKKKTKLPGHWFLGNIPLPVYHDSHYWPLPTSHMFDSGYTGVSSISHFRLVADINWQRTLFAKK
jgi:hypothetical protein